MDFPSRYRGEQTVLDELREAREERRWVLPAGSAQRRTNPDPCADLGQDVLGFV